MKTVTSDTFLQLRDTGGLILHVERVFIQVTTIDGIASQKRVVVPVGLLMRDRASGVTRFRIDASGELYATWRDAARELEDRVRPEPPDWEQIE